MKTQNKASWEDNIKKEFEEKFVYSDGVIDEDAEEVWEWIKKNFVAKDEVREMLKNLTQYKIVSDYTLDLKSYILFEDLQKLLKSLE